MGDPKLIKTKGNEKTKRESRDDEEEEEIGYLMQ